MERPLHASVAVMVRHAWRVPADEHVAVGELVRLSGSARSRVWRVVASRNDGARTRTFIVKAPEAVEGQHTDREGRLGNEWAALTFLEQRLPQRTRSMSPRLLGSDLVVGVLLLEDLAPIKGGLDELLLGAMKVQGGAATSVLKLATVLAQLHGRCHGHCDAYTALRASCGLHLKPPPDSSSVQQLRATATTLLVRDGSCDHAVMDGFVAELEVAFRASFSAAGPFATLIHGDMCPTNTAVLNKAGDVALLDFEFARIGNAIMDVSVLRMGFPTSHYAGRLPRALLRDAEKLYRQTAAECGLAAAADRTQWRHAMAECCALWTWGFLRASVERRVMDGDSPMGRKVACTRRQLMLYRLRVCVKALRKHAAMPAVLHVTDAVLQSLTKLWGPLDESPSLLYPMKSP